MAAETSIRLIVNGEPLGTRAARDTPLLDVLRDEFDLKGARPGCRSGACGSCHVLIEGRSVAACDTPLWAAADRVITTPEALPKAIADAFFDEQAAQCGYCSAGMMVAAAALLSEHPNPDEAAVREALDRHLCRCGAHPRIVRAVLRAAATLRGEPVAPAPSEARSPEPLTGESDDTTSLPAALLRHPRPSQWLGVTAEGEILLRSGKVEIGQGIQTALAVIVAETLGWPLDRVRVVHPSTDTHPDEGVTSGSLSIQDSGSALRAVAATLRHRLCEAAARQLGCDPTFLDLRDGQFERRDKRESASLPEAAAMLAALLSDGQIDEPITALAPQREQARPDQVAQSQPRRELREVFDARGDYFIQDRVIAPMLHGRVIHPPSPRHRLTGNALARLDGLLDAVARMPGIRHAWRDGALLGLLGDTLPEVQGAAERLSAGLEWTDGSIDAHDSPHSPAQATAPFASLRPDDWPQIPGAARVVAEHPVRNEATARSTTDPTALHTDAMRTEQLAPTALSARYTRPWIAHASIGPSCALARWGQPQQLEIWTHSQGIFGLRRDLAMAFDLAEHAIVVHHVPGSGCYGHNAADDVAFDAAWLARQVPGTTVRLLWTREDEFSKAPLGPAMCIELSAEIDAEGRVLDWRHELWSPGHSSRPGRSATPALLGNAERAHGHPLPDAIDMPLAVGGGAERNALPAYDFPRWTVLAHRVMTPWRSSALRSLGAFGNVFAAESFIDELALAAGRCPLDWRLGLLNHDARAQAVLKAAASRVQWQPGDPARGLGTRDPAEGKGRGLGFARYKNTGAWCAVIADIEAQASVRITRLTIAVDVGRAINPDGVVQQIEGGALQASSWTLREAIEPDASARPRATSWDDVPILRFTEVPALDVIVLPSASAPLGAGEASVGPTSAALANALAHALGVRVRSLPLTPERIVEAMQD